MEPGNRAAVARWMMEVNLHVARLSSIMSPVSYILIIYITVHHLISLFRIFKIVTASSPKIKIKERRMRNISKHDLHRRECIFLASSIFKAIY